MIDVITDLVWLQTMTVYKLAGILDEGLLSNGMYAVTFARKEGAVVWRLMVARQGLKSLQLSSN